MNFKTLPFLLILLSLSFPIFSQDKEKLPLELETVSLPKSPNAWIINIHQRGGLLGIHKLLVAINSDGKFACGENGKAQTILQDDKNFLELAELIKPIQDDIFLKTINKAFESCDDCLYSTFSFRRKKEKVKDGEIVEVSAKQTNPPTAKEVSEKVWKTVKCD
jgi:hypothetical protein